MKVKKYLSAFAAVGVVAFSLVACSDYDNGYNESAIQFTEEFKKAYGDIDPEQDWNLAERASVTVSTQTQSDIKIYAQNGNEYAIVANYEGVSGTRVLGFDVVEGITNVIVSDGNSAQRVKIGDVVLFGQDTRTTYEGTTGKVTVSKLKAPVTLSDGITYPVYRYGTKAEYDSVANKYSSYAIVREGENNLNKVTHNFSYVSTGPFVIYPYYWQTSEHNTLGIYYYEGGVRKEVPIYKIKEANEGEASEILYEDVNKGGDAVVYEETLTSLTQVGWGDSRKWPEGWTINNGIGIDKFHYNGWSKEQDESNMRTPFIEYWVGAHNSLQNCTISKTITGLAPGNYNVHIDARLFNEESTTPPSGVTFFANDKESTIPNSGTYTVYNNGNVSSQSAELYGDTYVTDCVVGRDGKLTVGFKLENVVGNWLAFKNLRVTKHGTYQDTGDLVSYSAAFVRSQGILVDITPGTEFGMYLHAGDKNITYYSQAELNNDVAIYGTGVVYDGARWVEKDGSYPCYASTFTVNGQMYLGFEDWSYPTNSDKDLNDLVVAFSGYTPTIINEDPEPAATWLLACEDLGGSFDTDYNDVVFKVEHVSGQEFAIATPLAAGGTLASYIFYESPSGQETCLGEIHQLFGEAPAESGSYSPINVGYSRGNAGQSVTFTVPADWSMSSFTPDVWNGNTQDAYYNMGGFEIRTLPMGTAAPDGTPTLDNIVSSGASRIPAPDQGAAPYIICLPYSYDVENDPEAGWKSTYVWAWPQELVTITPSQTDKYGSGCYPEFKDWVANHTAYGDWYKKRSQNAATVEELKLSTTQMGSSSQGGGNGSDDNDDDDDQLSKAFYFKYEPLSINGNWPGQSELIGEDNVPTNVSGLTAGQYFWIYSKNAYGEELHRNGLTATYNGVTYAIGTNMNNWSNAIGFYLVGAGDQTVVLHAPADESKGYAEQTVTLKLKLNGLTKEGETGNIINFTFTDNGTTYALAYRDAGTLGMKTYNASDTSQQWLIVNYGTDSSDGMRHYFLYNVGAQKYMYLAANGWSGEFNETSPKNMAVSSDKNRGKYKFYDASQLDANQGGKVVIAVATYYTSDHMAYIGRDTAGDGQGVYLNKGTGNIVYWTQTVTNQTYTLPAANSAKQRSAKQRSAKQRSAKQR